MGAIKACDELGKKIGKDVSIITFDGPVIEFLTTPPLTAITHPRKKLGYKAQLFEIAGVLFFRLCVGGDDIV